MIALSPGGEYLAATIELLRPAQVEILRSILTNRYTAILGARQWGKSEAITLTALILALGYDDGVTHIPAHDVLILSANAKKSQHLIRLAARHLKIACQFEDFTHPKLGNLERLALSNGRYIQAMPSDAEGMQSFSGTVIIDEMSITDANPEDLLTQALSVSSAFPHFRVVIVTNADVGGSFVDKFFWDTDERWVKRRGKFNTIVRTIHDVYGPELPEHITDIKDVITDASWRRFYLCESVSSDDAVLSPEALAESYQSHGLAPGQRGTMIAGLDIGYVKNPSGFVVWHASEFGVQLHSADEWYRHDADRQYHDVIERIDREQIRRLHVDAGAVGYDLAHRLHATLGDHRCTLVSVNDTLRLSAAMTLDSLARSGRAALGNAPAWLREEWAACRVSPDGKKLIVPRLPGIDRKTERHCDGAEASFYPMLDPLIIRRQPTHETVFRRTRQNANTNELTRLRGFGSGGRSLIN